MLLTDFIKSVFLLESRPKLKDDVLPETGVVAGTYGEIAEVPPEDETHETERVLKVPNITVDDKGRITNVALSDVSLNEIVTVGDDQRIIGSKTFTSGLSVNAGDNGVTASVDNSYLELTGATSSSNGAWLDLHGKDDSSNGGSFRLGANNGTNTVRLVGTADGKITWGGKGFVFLAGDQTIHGNKTFANSLILVPGANGIKTTSNEDYVEICGGTDNTQGAFLNLHGKEHTTQPGIFKLAAADGTNVKRLIGDANGELTWDGNPVVVDHNGYTFSGAIYAETPTELTDDSTQIATTEWVHDVVDDGISDAMHSLAEAMGDDTSGAVPNKGQREVWVVEEAIASGTDVTLPNNMAYVVGDNRLFAVVNGVILMPGLNYDEVGNDGDVSTTIRFNMPLSAGDEVMVYTIPVRVVIIDSASGS